MLPKQKTQLAADFLFAADKLLSTDDGVPCFTAATI